MYTLHFKSSTNCTHVENNSFLFIFISYVMFFKKRIAFRQFLLQISEGKMKTAFFPPWIITQQFIMIAPRPPWKRRSIRHKKT